MTDEEKVIKITTALMSHFGHSATQADIEDAAWSVLQHLED